MLFWFSQSQVDSICIDTMFIAAYLVAIFISNKSQIAPCLLAVIACQIYGLSPLYNSTLESSPSLVFIVYASIYFTVIRFLSDYKVILACFIMAIFECVMYKAYLNELGFKGIEEALYDNYEYIVTLLHAYIILQVVQWRKLQRMARGFRDNLLRPILHNSLLLPYRG